MRAVKGRDTAPEILVRRLAHSMGYRFRLHRKDLPGTPDLVFPRLRKVLFVNGCFWHGHNCARGSRAPKSNYEYWANKLARNVARDKMALQDLECLGWGYLVVWECEIKNHEDLRRALQDFLGDRIHLPYGMRAG